LIRCSFHEAARVATIAAKSTPKLRNQRHIQNTALSMVGTAVSGAEHCNERAPFRPIRLHPMPPTGQ
jgi:hypothetical protein